MARKDLFKGTLEALINPPETPARAHSKSILHSAALGAVETGLARGLQLLELDPDQIAESEFEDRLPYDQSALTDLMDSIRDHGQQIPILAQRIGANAFRVIYGRRRIAAARALGKPVRALVTQMDDDQRIIAQGIENTVRQDLSFIEKAMFAHRLREASIGDATIRAALNIDVGAPKATTISTMKFVVETLGEDLILAIGRAPGIGRPRWRSLAELFRDNAARFTGANRAALIAAIGEAGGVAEANPEDSDADARFKRAMHLIAATANTALPRADAHPVMAGETVVATVKQSQGALTVTVKAKDNPPFHAWLQANADRVVQSLHDQWQEETRQPQPEEEAR